MGTVIGEQARTLAASVLLGMVLALLYDLLRALRLRRRKNRAPLVWSNYTRRKNERSIYTPVSPAY